MMCSVLCCRPVRLGERWILKPLKPKLLCDESGRIEKIVARVTRNEAHRVIEEAMLAANVCSADFIASKQAARFVSRARRSHP
jgi:exoribonuclease R